MRMMIDGSGLVWEEVRDFDQAANVIKNALTKGLSDITITPNADEQAIEIRIRPPRLTFAKETLQEMVELVALAQRGSG